MRRYYLRHLGTIESTLKFLSEDWVTHCRNGHMVLLCFRRTHQSGDTTSIRTDTGKGKVPVVALPGARKGDGWLDVEDEYLPVLRPFLFKLCGILVCILRAGAAR